MRNSRAERGRPGDIFLLRASAHPAERFYITGNEVSCDIKASRKADFFQLSGTSYHFLRAAFPAEPPHPVLGFYMCPYAVPKGIPPAYACFHGRVFCSSDCAKFCDCSATERLRHPSIENHFAMGRMRAGAMLSYSLRSEYTDLAELQQFYSLFSSFSRSSS